MVFKSMKCQFIWIILQYKAAYWSAITFGCLALFSIIRGVKIYKTISSRQNVVSQPGSDPELLCYVKMIFSYTVISREFCENVRISGIRKLCVRYQETQSIQNKEVKDLKKCINVFNNKRIKQICLRDRWMSSAVISSEVVFLSVQEL